MHLGPHVPSILQEGALALRLLGGSRGWLSDHGCALSTAARVVVLARHIGGL